MFAAGAPGWAQGASGGGGRDAAGGDALVPGRGHATLRKGGCWLLGRRGWVDVAQRSVGMPSHQRLEGGVGATLQGGRSGWHCWPTCAHRHAHRSCFLVPYPARSRAAATCGSPTAWPSPQASATSSGSSSRRCLAPTRSGSGGSSRTTSCSAAVVRAFHSFYDGLFEYPSL